MKLPLLFAASISLFASFVQADELKRIGLDGTPNIPAPAQEDGKDGIARIKKIDIAALELFPTAKKPSKGTILISPGGGYSILAVTHEGRDIAKLLNESGWDAAVLLYHVSEGSKTRDLAIADAKAGLALLQKRGGEFGLETKRIGIFGFSAGGHLTARLAHESAANPPAFVILLYPAYLEKEGQVLEDVKPLAVPTFIYVAKDDKLVTSSTVFAALLKEKGIPHEIYTPEHGGHGFGLKNPLPEGVREWPEKLRAFLDSVSADSAAK